MLLSMERKHMAFFHVIRLQFSSAPTINISESESEQASSVLFCCIFSQCLCISALRRVFPNIKTIINWIFRKNLNFQKLCLRMCVWQCAVKILKRYMHAIICDIYIHSYTRKIPILHLPLMAIHCKIIPEK